MLALVACSPPDDASRHSYGPDHQGGTTAVYLNRDPGGFDALKIGSANKATLQTQAAVYDMLFDLDPKTGDLQPRLGLSATPLEGGTIWRVALRPGVFFSNGEHFTSQAYVIHFGRLLASATAGAMTQSLGARLVSVHAVDDLTVDFVLAQPSPNFKVALATPGLAWFGLNAPGYTLQHQSDPDFAYRPVGNGPYMVKSITTGEGLTLVRNPRYWNPTTQHLDRIEYRVLGEGIAPFIALKAGDIDMMYASDDLTLARAKRDPAVLTYVGPPFFSGYRINLGAGRGPLADPRVREALVYSLNREAANKAWSQGLAEIASDAYGKGSPWYCPDLRYPGYRPELARRLIAAYGKPLHLTLGVEPFSARAAEIFQAMWKDVGIDVTVVTGSRGPGFYKQIREHAFDMWYAPGPGNNNPLMVDMDLGSWERNSPIGIRSKAIDESIGQVSSAKSRAALYTASCRYQQVLANELPFIRFTFAPNGLITRKYIGGVTPLTSADAQYYKVWLR
ncbi:ABC transporter substrate-binding protein [Sphingomonas sp.]|uniref:ABC transporter substrate-binding protein n=1 Tax=Sphingomonas sp. TaxID=28214 RepID=UPI0025D35658|nr:ABC transporter substrate-binding protein [Sphingomonas sp.]